MHNVEPPVELVGFSEEQEHGTGFKPFRCVFDATEEDQFHHSALILHHDAQFLACHLDADHLGKDLDISACGLDVHYPLD